MRILIENSVRLGWLAMVACLSSSLPAVATTKGPDAAGYTATDATVYSFIEIAGAGGSTSVLATTDDAVTALTLPFPFQFYGQSYTMVCASSNGLIWFVTSAPACVENGDFANTDLTTAGAPGNPPAIAPYWTDLTFAVGGGAVYYQTQGTAGSRKFIVEWSNAYPQATILSPNPVSVQVVLSEGTNNILFQYQTVSLGSSNPAANGAQATVGITGATGYNNNRELQWSFDAAVLNDGSAILFAPSSGPITATHFIVSAPSVAPAQSPVSFTIAALDASNNVVLAYPGTVHFTSTDATATLPADTTLTNGSGTFSATLKTLGNQTITATDTGNSSVTGVSASISVQALPVLSITKSHTGSFSQGQTSATYTVTVSNTGTSSTSSVVTVTETVPGGLTLISMAGSGWTCPGTASNNCTRSDALAPGSSYLPITVTVNVAANATTPQVNSVSASGSGLATATATDSTTITTTSTSALRFVPVTPCRVADTRKAAGPFGGPAITGGSTRNFIIPNSVCNIPATAQAYSLNVAVVPAGPLGYLTLWPAGQTQPVASTLNSLDGRTKSNAAIVPAGTGGAVSVFASNTTNVILDINGYFVPATTTGALAFYPVTPCRIADTRKANAPLYGPSLSGGQSRTFPILSSTCNIPSTAQAYSLNFAAVPPGPLGFITAFPTGTTQPVVASLNAPTGTVTANAAIVPAGTNGSIDIFASNNTNLVIDINGYFAPMGTGGLSLYNVTPCRELDSRKPTGTPPFSGVKDVLIAGNCGIPTGALAYVLSATVVPPGPLGYLTLWPQGQTQPVVATLNAVDGAVTSNLAIVPTVNGSISAFVSNPAQLILDIFGYFAQ